MHNGFSCDSPQNFKHLAPGVRPLRHSHLGRGRGAGGRVQIPGGVPVLSGQVLDKVFHSLTCCLQSINKFLIHWQIEADWQVHDFRLTLFHKWDPCICLWGVEVSQELVQFHVDCTTHWPACLVDTTGPQGSPWCLLGGSTPFCSKDFMITEVRHVVIWSWYWGFLLV